MEVVIKGEAKEIVALVLAVQERQEVIKSPNDARENMIKALAEVYGYYRRRMECLQ